MNEAIAFIRLIGRRGAWPILSCLLAGERTAAQIADELDHRLTSVRNQLTRLTKAGAIGFWKVGRVRTYWININLTWWITHTAGVAKGLAGDLGPSLPRMPLAYDDERRDAA